MNRLRTYLELTRTGLAPTAVADIVAGAAFVGEASLAHGPSLIMLCIASVCLYGGGMALNDIHDMAADAVHRPHRPLPSGRITRRAAIVLTCALMATGIVLAACIGSGTLVVAAALVLTIVCYDVWLKHTAIAPAIMGACRGLNLAMGMSLLPGVIISLAVLPIFSMWLFVTALTGFARTETRTSSPARLKITCALMITGVLSLNILYGFWWEDLSGNLVAASLATSLVIAFVARPAIADPAPGRVQQAVGSLVACIILLDLCIALAAGQAMIGVGLLLLFAMTGIIQRRKLAS